ncbi:flagellar hook-length control protein FliK [Trinickia sp. LjRoot230]|uniref:flagellar hook-length control protein FliK n=1 Tax=Trinickia sp. LjRoot230 TaxID=3342288 RepID=UPI003ECD6BD3
MTGIDSALAAVLASRIDSLIDNVAAGARTSATQTGASTQAGDLRAAPAGAAPIVDTTPPASAQATLSEVGLTLDAISRLGGEATPVVVGEAPIWPAPPAIEAPLAGQSGLFAQAAAGQARAHPPETGARADAAAARATGTAATATTAAATTSASLPVGALATALARTVAETGLFYESHLAQWLGGSYPAEALLNEPQTRIAAQAVQLPLDWAESDAGSPWSSDAQLSGWSSATANAGAAGSFVPPHAAAAQSLASTLAAQARADAGAYAGARQLPGFAGQNDGPGGGPSGTGTRAGETLAAPASIAASIHPATIALVRQQLDLLATEQFRWTGEVWPGAKLDWMIEPEPDRRRRPRGEQDDADDRAWRTRVTLALPTLGTVDADLVLKGTQLIVRVQASPTGAARLATGGAAFGRRLQAAGIELAGLSIREIGGGTPAGGAGVAATSAYARAAAADAEAHEVHEPDNVSNANNADASSKANQAASVAGGETASARAAPPAAGGARGASPLDRLLGDPFDWEGA